WKLVQRLDDPDPARANAQAREELANGATGLSLVFAGAPNAFGYGLPANPEALDAVLKNLPLDNLLLRIDVHPQSRASVDWLIEIGRASCRERVESVVRGLTRRQDIS